MNRKQFHPLFLPLIAAGIVITMFGVVLIILGKIVGSDGEGLSISGMRLLVGGAATLFLGYFAQYYSKIIRSLSLLKFIIFHFRKKDGVFGR